MEIKQKPRENDGTENDQLRPNITSDGAEPREKYDKKKKKKKKKQEKKDGI